MEAKREQLRTKLCIRLFYGLKDNDVALFKKTMQKLLDLVHKEPEAFLRMAETDLARIVRTLYDPLRLMTDNPRKIVNHDFIKIQSVDGTEGVFYVGAAPLPANTYLTCFPAHGAIVKSNVLKPKNDQEFAYVGLDAALKYITSHSTRLIGHIAFESILGVPTIREPYKLAHVTRDPAGAIGQAFRQRIRQTDNVNPVAMKSATEADPDYVAAMSDYLGTALAKGNARIDNNNGAVLVSVKTINPGDEIFYPRNAEYWLHHAFPGKVHENEMQFCAAIARNGPLRTEFTKYVTQFLS